MIDKFGRAMNRTLTANTGVTKSYIRTNYIESNIEEDIDMKNTFKIKNLPDPTLPQDPTTKIYVDTELDDSTIVRTNKINDFNGNKIINCESIRVNRDPESDLELATKQYTDTSIDEFSLLRLHADEKLNFDGKDFITIESNLTTPKTIIYIPLNKNLVRSDRDNDLNNNKITNVKDPTNDNDVANKKYVDSKSITGAVKQDLSNSITTSSEIIELLLSTTTGEFSFPMATKRYVDKFLYNDYQFVKSFTNNSGQDLWLEFELEISSGINSFEGFFKSSTLETSSGETGPSGLPPDGERYAFIECSTPNFGPDRYGIITYTRHQNITKVRFYYHRTGRTMCRFRIQYLSLEDEWIDQIIFPSGDFSIDWTLLEENFLFDNKGIRFYFDEIFDYLSDMAISTITIEYNSPK